jgi:hypothetical protein
LRKNLWFDTSEPCDERPSGKSDHATILARHSALLQRTACTGQIDQPCSSQNLRLSAGENQSSKRALEAIIDASHPLPGPRPLVGIFANATGGKRQDEKWRVQWVGALQVALADVLVVDVLAERKRAQGIGAAGICSGAGRAGIKRSEPGMNRSRGGSHVRRHNGEPDGRRCAPVCRCND